MNLRAVKKKFRQEVILDVNGTRNSNFVIAREFVALCFNVLGGFVLTLVLAPVSLFRPIEIWYLRSRRIKISLLIEDLEFGLRNLQKNGVSPRPIVIATYFLPFPNNYLVKMYRRVTILLGTNQRFLGSSLEYVRPIGKISKKLPIERYPQMFNTWNDGVTSIHFTAKERIRGFELESELFNGKNPPFVCLALASTKYRRMVDIPESRFSGELRDDPLASMPELINYFPVISFLAQLGMWVVRVGVNEEERLPSHLGPKVIDYAFKNRTEFGDLWLHSRCQFSISAGCGAHWLAAVFNRPAILTDSYAIRSLYDNRSLFIPQRGWLSNERRYITFSEIQNNEFGRDKKLLQNGMTIIKNSPEEIIDVTDEMICRLAGTWTETKQDQELQHRYRKLVDSFPVHQRTPARMGAKFLREHQHLLPE